MMASSSSSSSSSSANSHYRMRRDVGTSSSSSGSSREKDGDGDGDDGAFSVILKKYLAATSSSSRLSGVPVLPRFTDVIRLVNNYYSNHECTSSSYQHHLNECLTARQHQLQRIVESSRLDTVSTTSRGHAIAVPCDSFFVCFGVSDSSKGSYAHADNANVML